VSASVRPLHWVTPHVAQAIELRVLAALTAWAQDWLPQDQVPLHVKVSALTALPNEKEPFELHAAAGARLWVRQSPSDSQSLAAALLASAADTADPILAHAAQCAACERNASLALALVGEAAACQPATPDPSLAAFASGALQLECPAIGLFAVTDASALRHVAPGERAPALERPAPLLRALGRASATATAVLGRVELPLNDLLQMRAGDVLRLPTSLEAALALEVSGVCFATAELGRVGHQVSVQLLAPVPR
jgi:flagellar motor switch/type III secretory pathway protein FliN